MAYIYPELMKHLKEVADVDEAVAVAEVEVVEEAVKETIIEDEKPQSIIHQ